MANRHSNQSDYTDVNSNFLQHEGGICCPIVGRHAQLSHCPFETPPHSLAAESPSFGITLGFAAIVCALVFILASLYKRQKAHEPKTKSDREIYREKLDCLVKDMKFVIELGKDPAVSNPHGLENQISDKRRILFFLKHIDRIGLNGMVPEAVMEEPNDIEIRHVRRRPVNAAEDIDPPPRYEIEPQA